MRLMLAQFLGSILGGLLLINSQNVDPHLEAWFIVCGSAVMSGVNNYVGFRNGINNK